MSETLKQLETDFSLCMDCLANTSKKAKLQR